MKYIGRQQTLEHLFPAKEGRAAADAAIDKLPNSMTVEAMMEAWEAAYFARTGTSPMRKPR